MIYRRQSHKKLQSFVANWKLPLRLVLVVPFVSQIAVAVGLTGWLSLQNGEKAVNDLATQLREEISARIAQQLKDYLEVPRTIDRINANAIQLGQLNFQDTGSLSRQFWWQRNLFDPIEVSAIYFGSSGGEFIGLGFQNNQTWQIGRAGKITNNKFHSYAIDDRGNPGKLLEIGKPYDPRIRPWYQKSVAAKRPLWSDIYADFKEPRLKITWTEPVYDRAGKLQGVLGVDFVLSHIREFLQRLKIGKSGQTFIIERSGFLVATSNAEQPFTIAGKKVERLKAVDAKTRSIRETAKYLESYLGNFSKLKSSQQLKLKIDGEPQFLQVVPFSDRENLDWLIVVVVPENDFMERINSNTRHTIILCFVALIIAVVVGLLTSRWITEPILKICEASLEIASGNFDKIVCIPRQDELGTLVKTFDRMRTELKVSHEQLEEYSRVLEHKVLERTKQLQHEKEKSERLLLNILPKVIAERLKNHEGAIAEQFDEVTILFADIVGFTPLSSRLPPIELVIFLNQIFSSFDRLTERYGLEKIKTIGDAYMVVGGLPLPKKDHAEAIADMALSMQQAIAKLQAESGEKFQIRIGINTGSVVAGVIGTTKFIYDLWGDAVNIASRMESHGKPGCIQVTDTTYEYLKHQYELEKRDEIVIKGKGKMTTYWLQAKKTELISNSIDR
ncbi:MAG: HAMP domain-containing protein [Oscillatoriaceae cyanobacterium Prado104]|jgi:class 3 adenylate cyclase|nr:HAMP domain-containing protein [Oscillatoriaceae cyanobacterium Prado104]